MNNQIIKSNRNVNIVKTVLTVVSLGVAGIVLELSKALINIEH